MPWIQETVFAERYPEHRHDLPLMAAALLLVVIKGREGAVGAGGQPEPAGPARRVRAVLPTGRGPSRDPSVGKDEDRWCGHRAPFAAPHGCLTGAGTRNVTLGTVLVGLDGVDLSQVGLQLFTDQSASPIGCFHLAVAGVGGQRILPAGSSCSLQGGITRADGGSDRVLSR